MLSAQGHIQNHDHGKAPDHGKGQGHQPGESTAQQRLDDRGKFSKPVDHFHSENPIFMETSVEMQFIRASIVQNEVLSNTGESESLSS